MQTTTSNTRIIFLWIVILVSTLTGCKKNATQALDYTGTYTGDILVYTDGVYQIQASGYIYEQTIYGSSIQITPSGKPGEYLISNNMITADTASMTAGKLEIPKTFVQAVGIDNIFEMGQASLSGNILKVDFYQDYVSSYNSMLGSSFHWTGQLKKQ
jgi:hypothetical protein